MKVLTSLICVGPESSTHCNWRKHMQVDKTQAKQENIFINLTTQHNTSHYTQHNTSHYTHLAKHMQCTRGNKQPDECTAGSPAASDSSLQAHFDLYLHKHDLIGQRLGLTICLNLIWLACACCKQHKAKQWIHNAVQQRMTSPHSKWMSSVSMKPPMWTCVLHLILNQETTKNCMW